MKSLTGVAAAVVFAGACVVVSHVAAADQEKAPAIHPASDLVGTWQVKMLAHFSTCTTAFIGPTGGGARVNAGDESAATWNISSSKGALHVKVGSNASASYDGEIEQDGTVDLWANGQVWTAGMELHGDSNALKGQYTSAQLTRNLNDEMAICIVTYNVTLTKTK